jgi:hypothetical protein
MTTDLIDESVNVSREPTDAVAEVLAAEPEEPLVVAAQEDSTLGLVELLLKNNDRLDVLINREPKRQPILVPRFLGIALASNILFAVAMIVILNTAPHAAYPPFVPAASWANRSALGLLVGYTFGLVATSCICLPSFYFFGLLAGVRLTMLQIVAQVVRAKAVAALVLVGILPIYFAVVLGLTVFGAGTVVLQYCLGVGLLLPFLAGLEGVRAIYRGVLGMAETLPPERRCRRECFLRRLTVSWAACYTGVAPVMVYRLWELLAGHFA